MKATTVTRNLTNITVTVELPSESRPVSDDLIVGFAMASVNETPDSLFGWSVSRSDEFPFATVALNTD